MSDEGRAREDLRLTTWPGDVQPIPGRQGYFISADGSVFFARRVRPHGSRVVIDGGSRSIAVLLREVFGAR